MPVAPPRACPRPGCPELQPCPVHRKGETYRERVTARPWAAMYKEQRWVRLSARVRNEEPVCVECIRKGQTPRPTRHADHITPHRGDRVLFFDRSNVQGICANCHSAKTKRETR
jgi:5-methylcytosine-specific restriction protein A